METQNIILAGVGGQGTLLGSEITARAAILAGYEVKTNETHGMAQRGGSVIAHVRFGDTVASPLVAEGEAMWLAAFEGIEALRNAHYLAPGGLAVISSQSIVPVTVTSGNQRYPQDLADRVQAVFPRHVLMDAASIAGQLGNPRAANVVVLGALAGNTPIEEKYWRESIEQCVPEKYLELNMKAFEAGQTVKGA